VTHRSQNSRTSFGETTMSRPSDLTSAMATKFTCKRISLLFAPVLIALIVPTFLSMIMAALETLSRGYGMLCVILSVGITAVACMKIKELAPSPIKSAEALQSRNRIFGLSLLCSILGCRYLVSLAFPRLNWSRGFCAATLFLGARLAVGVFFLGLLVSLRYIGPCAIGKRHNHPTRYDGTKIELQ